MKKLHIAFVLYFILTSWLYAQNEKIDLLLKWKHQFQFAGYYMAKEKGFYNDLELDVNIKVSLDKDTPTKLEDMHSTYAILDPSALIEQKNDRKIRALAAIFQQSPVIFLSLKSNDIKSPQDFVGKNIVAILEKNNATLATLLKKEGIKNNQFNLIQKYPSINDLIENKADIISAYLTDSPYLLKEMGYEYNIIDPLAYGIDFYGDMIFTSQNEVSNHPNRVKRFLSATFKGWYYALNNIDETIEVIKNKYKSELDIKTLKYEALKTKELIMPERIPIGQINNTKINSILTIFDELGYINLNKNEKNINILQSNNFNISFVEFWKNLTLEEKNFLKNHKKIVLGVRDNFLPFYGLNNEGNKKGLIVDLNKKFENLLGINLELKPILIKNMSDKLKKGEIDLFYGTKVAHGGDYLYTKPFATYSAAAFSKDKNLKINSIESLKNKKVAVLKGTNAKKYLKDITVIEKKDIFDLLNSISSGEADILIDAKPSVEYYKKNYKVNKLYLNGIFYQYLLNLSLVMKKDQLILKHIFDKAIKYIGEKNLEKLFAPLTSNENNFNKLKLNQKEVDFLTKHSTVTVGTDINWPPFDFTKNGVAQGYSVDFLKLIEQKTGLHFKFINKYPWHETVNLFKHKKIDMLSIIGKNKEREKFTLFTAPILSSSISIAYKKGTTEKTIEFFNTNSLKLGVIKDYWIVDKIKSLYPHIKVVEYKSSVDAFKDISNGKIGGFIGTTNFLSYQINRNLFTDISLSSPVILKNKSHEKYFIGVRKDLPILYSIIQKAIDSIKEDEILKLYTKWFGNMLEGSISKKLLLSDAQKEFLSSHKDIRLGIDTSWPPFDFVDEKGNYQGIIKDITNYIFKNNLELNIKPITQTNWNKHIKAIEDKKIDVIAGIVKSPKRSEKMLFSNPYLKLPLVIVGKSNNILIDSLSDLKGKEVGVIKGYITYNILKENIHL
ncbi:transporter substrate-binding domain-containing protein [Sulfurospirillum sp. 1307]